MAAFQSLFGAKLQKGTEQVDTAEALKDKAAVAIYFSAHWCPPCRGFTPKLAEWYKNDLQGKGLEVVFVSSDRDEKSFGEYFGEQPWLALPFSARDEKTALSKKFKVQGIPSLVILDGATGATITKDGREAVSSDPKGEDFPWKPIPVKEILSSASYLHQDGSVKAVDFSGKKVGLYFSAHWCPPCRGFTPLLADTYKKLVTDGKPFELVFVSSDRDEAQFKEYFGTMPWLALPYAERKKKDQLSQAFSVSGIPSMVILDADKDFEVVTSKAVGAIRGAAKGDSAEEKAAAGAAGFPWMPELLRELDSDPDGIDEAASFIVLQEGLGAEAQASNKALLKPLVEKLNAEMKANGEEGPKFNVFFASKKGGDLAERVRGECGGMECEGGKLDVVMMDIPDNGAFYDFSKAGKELGCEAFEKFFEEFKAGVLKRQQMG